jgi:MFS superfamily sulfate permease-like transporter
MSEENQKVDWRREILASVVVFLVALPLCMGIAIASGAPPALGLVSGIVGGLVVGVIAGSPLQVSGPAAGLAVLVWQLIENYGLSALGWVGLGAGLLQMISGAAKLGRWFRAVSPAVIHGMLAGIGVLIFGSQFHVMVDDSPRSSGLMNLATIPQAIQKGLLPIDGSVHHLAATIGVITILSIIGWNKFRPARMKAVPAPLFAVVIATALAGLLSLPIQYVQIPASIIDGLNVPKFGELGALIMEPGFWGAVIGFAVIASAETLLCATAVDKMHDGERTKYDKELFAQGVGNSICGVLGALPITGVIVRSSANVEAGAKTRYSAIMHGGWLLLFVVMLPFVVSWIPTAALAAILVYTGYKLVNPKTIRTLAKVGKSEVFIYTATVVAIVSTNLLSGVLIGFGLALGKLLYTFLHLHVQLKQSEDGRQAEISLRGSATFVQLPRLAEKLDSIDEAASVKFHLGSLTYVDHAIMELVSEWRDRRSGAVSIDWNQWKEPFKRLTKAEKEARDTEGGNLLPASAPNEA